MSDMTENHISTDLLGLFIIVGVYFTQENNQYFSTM